MASKRALNFSFEKFFTEKRAKTTERKRKLNRIIKILNTRCWEPGDPTPRTIRSLLRDHTKESLLRINGIGQTMLDDIIAMLETADLHLREK